MTALVLFMSRNFIFIFFDFEMLSSIKNEIPDRVGDKFILG